MKKMREEEPVGFTSVIATYQADPMVATCIGSGSQSELVQCIAMLAFLHREDNGEAGIAARTLIVQLHLTATP